MEHTLFLDIETISTQRDDVRDRFRKEVKAPGNIKKPESIDKWMEKNADAAAADQIAKTSFDPAYGHICCIGWAVDDDVVQTVSARTADGEAEMLERFFVSLAEHHRYTFVGHNVAAFDLRFILCRAVVLGIRVPGSIPVDPKPWDGRVFDTMTAWAGARGTIGMDRLCDALGIPGKGDFDGGMVADAWAAGEHDRIARYCADDVTRTREIWRRFQAAGLA